MKSHEKAGGKRLLSMAVILPIPCQKPLVQLGTSMIVRTSENVHREGAKDAKGNLKHKEG
jgi:hypothetical protein